MSDIEKMTHRRQLRNSVLVAIVASAALLAGCAAPAPAPPPPQPVTYPAPPPPPPPAPVVRG